MRTLLWFPLAVASLFGPLSPSPFGARTACSGIGVSSPDQLAAVINDPDAALVRGRVVGLEIGDPGGKVVIMVKVQESFFGNVDDSIRVQGYYAMAWHDDPKRPLSITEPEGSIWYKQGDDLLLLVKPFAKDSWAAGRFCQNLIRFITMDPKSGEEQTSIQTGHSVSRTFIEETRASGKMPTLEELLASIDRSFEPDGTLKQTVHKLLALRKH